MKRNTAPCVRGWMKSRWRFLICCGSPISRPLMANWCSMQSRRTPKHFNEDGARRGEDGVANSGICQRYGDNSLLLLSCCPESAPILMLYIMYNMVQRLPAGIRRHLSGDFVGAELHMQHIRRSGHGSSTESSVSSAAAL